MLSPHTPPKASQPESKCSFMLCPARGALPEWQNARTFYVCPRRCTRMMGMQNLPLPYTVLEASLSEITCSPVFAEHAPEWRDSGTCHCRTRCWQSACQKSHALPFLWNTHPNGRAAKPAGSAHAAENHSVNQRMLAHFLLIEPTFYPYCLCAPH